MTARSTDEAFAQTAGPLDLDSIESDVRQQAYYDDELLALVVEARDLRDSRERAIRWAVTLEGQNAAMEAALTEIEALAEKWRYKGEFGWGAWQEGHGPDEEGYILDQAAAEIRAALTGSTE